MLAVARGGAVAQRAFVGFAEMQGRELRRALAFLRTLADAYAQVEPRGLAGDRIGVRVFALRRDVGNQMIEQEALGAFRRILRQPPRAASLADRVPGPH